MKDSTLMKQILTKTLVTLGLALALACVGFSNYKTQSIPSHISAALMAAPASTDAGHLIIRRAANLGTGLFLDVDIDGASV